MSANVHLFAPRTNVQRTVEIIILVTLFCLYTFWASQLPTDGAPDEHLRFDLLYYIWNTGTLPVGDNPLIREESWGFSYAYSPYGSTLLALPFVWIASLFDSSPATLLFAGRMIDVIFAVATVFISFRIGHYFSKGDAHFPVLLGLIIGLLPQFAFLASYFNCDMMGVFCTALTLFLLLYCKTKRWSYGSLTLLGIALGLLAMSYNFAYGAFIAAIVYYYWEALRDAGRRTLKDLLVKPLFIFFVAFALAGWFFIRNAVLYQGDPFGFRARTEAGELYGVDIKKPSLHPTPRNLGMSPWGMLISGWRAEGMILDDTWLKMTLDSFFGKFGYAAIPLSRDLYNTYFIFFVVGFIAGIVGFFKLPRQTRKTLRPLVATLLILLIVPVTLSIYYSWNTDWQPQGRYIMAMLIPVALIVAWGYRTISQLFSKKGAAYFMWCVATIWIVFFLLAFIGTAIPLCTGGIGEVVIRF